jgi:hypothetical protein
MPLEPLELAVLQRLLEGDHPVLAGLRAQVPGLAVKDRRYTGAGFYTEFTVADTARPAAVPFEKVRFGDVQGTIEGMQDGAGFLLYVDRGLLRMLEGYSYDEPWPEKIKAFSLSYTRSDRKAELAKLGIAG